MILSTLQALLRNTSHVASLTLVLLSSVHRLHHTVFSPFTIFHLQFFYNLLYLNQFIHFVSEVRNVAQHGAKSFPHLCRILSDDLRHDRVVHVSSLFRHFISFFKFPTGCASRALFFFCFYSVQRRRLCGSTCKQQKNVSPMPERLSSGSNICCADVWGESLLLSRNTRTARNFQEIKHAFQLARITHVCSPSLMEENANAATDTSHCEKSRRNQKRTQVKQTENSLVTLPYKLS